VCAGASRGHRRIRGFGLAVLTILGVMALPAAAAQADSTWAGSSTATPPSPNWSDATNWVGVVAPTPSTAGVLTFSALAGTCTSCYTSHNDLTGVSATGLVFSNTTGQYRIVGNGLTVGSGGITDNPGGNTGDVINTPLTLGAAQTWSIGKGFGSNYNSLSLAGTATVTGPSSPTLGVTFPANLGSSSTGALFVDSDMEVGAVTVTGSGGLHIGAPGNPGSVNGTNGSPVGITNKATLVANPGAKVGALSFATGGQLLLGTGAGSTGAPGTLGVTGAATLDPTTTTTALINNNGSTPGTDFSQLSATGNIALANSTLNIAQGQVNGSCVALGRGDVAPLFTTTGTLSGTFANAPEGAVLTTASSCPTTQVKIHYTSNSVTAMVVSGSTPTTTTLATPNPSRASTNQKVTLTTTVATSTNGNIAPAGTVAFWANGTPISGCTSQQVTGSGTATCSASFAAKGSPVSLTAAFTGASGSAQANSTSRAQTLTVKKGSARTKLVASSRGSGAGRRVTYTATVNPDVPGASRPSGTVAFRDRGHLIPGCVAKRLRAGTARCTVFYRIARSHRVIATYRGDANFRGSSARAAR
jgi:hypothetical protein